MSLLSSKHFALIGLGSGGSAVSDMLARAGARRLTLIDPDQLTEENLKRHILTRKDLGRSKVEAMCDHIKSISDCLVDYGVDRFEDYAFLRKPDVIVAGADSDRCCQFVNDYSLRQNIPAVYGAVWGAAETAEIITVIPGLTPCYACYEREGPEPEPNQEKYTNPNYDPTKMPHQEGLWCDVLMAASVQFRAILEVLQYQRNIDIRNEQFRTKGVSYGCFGELASGINPLMLVSLRPPYGTEIIRQKRGCAVCSDDFSRLTV